MKYWEVASHLIENRRTTRTRRGSPCPVCGHSDSHCLRMDDDSAALCPKSDGTGSIRKYGEYGYLYLLSPGTLAETYLPPVKKRRTRTDQEMDVIWRPRVTRWCRQGRSEIGRLAVILGVSVDSLRQLRTGFDDNAWTTPERNETGLIVGVSRRLVAGGKRCAVGSRRGLTYSDQWLKQDGPILIVEGASDTAAGITLGLSVIGRPSNVGGLRMLASMLRWTSKQVIVISERDRKQHDDLAEIVRRKHNPQCRGCPSCWPGCFGARIAAVALSKSLSRKVTSRLLPDDAKDLRSWLNDGGIDPENRKALNLTGQKLLQTLG